jgi:hypothetical protein
MRDLAEGKLGWIHYIIAFKKQGSKSSRPLEKVYVYNPVANIAPIKSKTRPEESAV